MNKTPGKYLVGTRMYDGRIYVDGHDLYHYFLLSGDTELADVVMVWFKMNIGYQQTYKKKEDV